MVGVASMWSCPPQACIKPQYVDQIPKAVKGTVQAMLDRKDELHVQEKICKDFGKKCSKVSILPASLPPCLLSSTRLAGLTS